MFTPFREFLDSSFVGADAGAAGMLLAQVMLPAAASALATATPAPRTVVVAGATGRSGRLLVEELLKGDTVVRALVRDRTKAAETLPSHPNLSLIDCDLASITAAATTREACASANGLVWCASGFTSDGVSLDVKCMGELPLALKEVGAADARVVMLSSAGVTRTEWPEAKQTALVGAADIPIIRLNPVRHACAATQMPAPAPEPEPEAELEPEPEPES